MHGSGSVAAPSPATSPSAVAFSIDGVCASASMFAPDIVFTCSEVSCSTPSSTHSSLVVSSSRTSVAVLTSIATRTVPRACTPPPFAPRITRLRSISPIPSLIPMRSSGTSHRPSRTGLDVNVRSQIITRAQPSRQSGVRGTTPASSHTGDEVLTRPVLLNRAPHASTVAKSRAILTRDTCGGRRGGGRISDSEVPIRTTERDGRAVDGAGSGTGGKKTGHAP